MAKPSKTIKPAMELLQKCPTGIKGLDEITGGGFPRAADPGLRRRRLRQDPAGHRVPGPRSHAVRRAGRVHGLRGDRRRTDAERPLRWASTSTTWSSRKKLVARLRPHRAERDRGDGRVRPGRPVHPPGPRDRLDRRQAGRARHHRNALRRPARTTAILRAELRRLFRWLKEKGVTAIITGERGDGR